jgi:hypothetical protein
VQRIVFAILALEWGLTGLLLYPLSADEPAPAASKKTDAFFAGTVVESSEEKLTVTRTVLGKAENRSFQVTPDTKIEGRLRIKVRVTVRYVSDEDGDTATMIIVRSATANPPVKKQ